MLNVATTSKSNVDPRITTMVEETCSALGYNGDRHFHMIYRSWDYPDTRQVWKLILGDQVYALKLDFEADAEGRIAKEYRQLQEMGAHFAKYDKLELATPVYLSPQGQFCVTRFLDHKTAGQRLQAVDNAQTRKQVFRRAGQFLHALHEYRPLKRKAYWGNWMPLEVDEIVARGEMQADPADVASLREQLKSQVRTVNKVKDTHAWSHGDFHGENLMLGPGVTYGFDFTEARRKMAVYDIVDFLKVDIYRRTPRDELDNAGITTLHREMFFKGYKHPINHDILDISLRGRLLIDWVSINKADYDRDENRRKTFDRFKYRIDVAFGRA